MLAVYVELDTYLIPLSAQIHDSERGKTQPLMAALVSDPAHAVILGQPGAGKTTSLQKICADYFERKTILLNYSFPIVIRLRNLQKDEEYRPLLRAFIETLGFTFNFGAEQGSKISKDLTRQLVEDSVCTYLESLSALILLDGFDEIPQPEVKSQTLEDISNLCRKLHKTKLVLTSRSSEFKYQVESMSRYEIAPLTKGQIETFAVNWLGNKKSSDDFLNKVLNSPFADTAIRPLTIAHLCAVYERISDIPEKPKSVYRKIVYLLLEEWDAQRQIKRAAGYAGFDPDRKLEFLAHLAYVLTTKMQRSRFDERMLEEAYQIVSIDFSLPQRDSRKVIGEIESHNGLLMESGYRNYEFGHKSLQEFLSAEYIVKLPSIRLIAADVAFLPNELAIAVSLSSRPSDYLCELVLGVFAKDYYPSGFIDIFLYRLAIEKPDLHYSVDVAIASCYLLSISRAPEDHISLLRSTLPTGFHVGLRQFYKESSRDEKDVRLELTRVHAHYNLPTRLKVPVSLLPSQ